jgi:hypothetical protein
MREATTMANKLPIPKHLSKKEWTSHKGIIAKILTASRKTGITEALEDFEKYYNFKFGWGVTGDSEVQGYAKWALSQKPSEKDMGIAHLKLGLKEIRGSFLGDAKTKLDKIKNLATTKATEFKANKLIPSSSRVYLEEMAKTSGTFHDQLKKALADSETKIKAALVKAGVKV